MILTAALLAVLVCGTTWSVVDETKAENRVFWRLDFKHTGLHYVRVGGQLVAYTTYQVTNNTGVDRMFFPIFRVTTDTEQVTYAMSNPAALREIQAKHRTRFLDIDEMSGTIKAGETRVGAAIFYKLDPEADHVKVEISGLTDAYRYLDEQARTGHQRRIYVVQWYRPGDAIGRDADPVETKFDDWIWRSTGIAATAPEE
ncbi:MAG TPA: hypothetical protein VMX57_01630 [Planctomycetota bacterium]|nr:hypothetical protein [Planctomycetota bacterium]